MNFFETIYKTLKENPNREVIYWKDSTSTGASLLGKISGIRNKLSKSGLRSTEEIIIATSVGETLISSILAVMASGATPLIPPAGCTTSELLELIKKREIKRVVVDKISLKLHAFAFFTSIKIIEVAKIKGISAEMTIKGVVPHQSALITHSSGSTGKSKAVYRTHKVLLEQHEVLKRTFPPFENQIDFPLFPNILLHNLCLGVPSVLPSIDRFKLNFLDPHQLISQIERHKVKTLTGNVYYFRRLSEYCQSSSRRIEGVKALGIGGSPVPENLLADMKACFPSADRYVIYGSSEAEPIAIRKVENVNTNLSFGYCVGTIVEELQLTFDTPALLTLTNGDNVEAGEITIKGKHVATPGESLKTGDWGFLKDGNLYLTARKGNEAILKGVQHYQVEHVLQHFPGIKQVAAVADKEAFDIFYSGSANEKAVRNMLESSFPSDIFRKIKVLPELPMDKRHLSKILYEKLK